MKVTVPYTLRSVLTFMSTGLLGDVDVGTDFFTLSTLSSLSALGSVVSSTLIAGLGDLFPPKKVLA